MARATRANPRQMLSTEHVRLVLAPASLPDPPFSNQAQNGPNKMQRWLLHCQPHSLPHQPPIHLPLSISCLRSTTMHPY